jgi:oligopeptide transport system substrate-binding protein
MSRGTGGAQPDPTPEEVPAIVPATEEPAEEPLEEPTREVQQVEVTRVVTEVVTEIQEVVVTPEEEVAAIEAGPVTLRVNWGTEDLTIDPSLATDTTSVDIVSNTFMALTRLDPHTGEVLPYLATSWEVSDDGLIYTFYMRSDVPWVNYNPNSGEWTQEFDPSGNPRFVNAHDVVYGVQRTIDPTTESDYAYVLYGIANAQVVNEEQEGVTLDSLGVQALDDFTVQFTLEDTAAFFPSIAAMWLAAPQPQWVIDEWGNKWTEAGLIVTNGPMGLEQWIHGAKLNLVKNPLWPEADSVQIERVEGAMIPDQATAFAMYQNNELDTVDVPVDEFDSAKADPVLSAELVTEPLPCTYYYGFTNNKPPFDDVRVRTAFVQAIEATSFAPPGMFGAPAPGAAGLPHDTAAAQAALQDYLDEKGMTLDDFNALGVILMHNTSEGHANIAAAVQQMWRDTLGVDVIVENQEWRVYLDTIGNTTPIAEAPHIFRLGWCADYADENNWVHEVFNADAGANRLRRNCTDDTCSNVSLTQFDEFTIAAAQETDPAMREELYAIAEEILAVEEAAYAPLYHYGDLNVTKPWLIRDYAPFGGNDISTWTIDQEAQLQAIGQ